MTGSGTNGVLLLGEAYGQTEQRRGQPFQGPAGALLARMLSMGGWDRDAFLITNVCWHQPVGNRDPTPAEIEADRPRWEPLVQRADIRVVVPLGSIPLEALTSESNILDRRGYQEWSERYQRWILPTVHPAYILRGNTNWTGTWIRDIQTALQIAQRGPQTAPQRTFILDPIPEALLLAKWRWEGQGCPPLAFDLETPDKAADEDEAAVALGQQAAPIYRIGVAWVEAQETVALSVPWGSGSSALITTWLTDAPQVLVWNRHFDVPRVRAHGVAVSLDRLHDVQELWHVLYPDLPKRLVFAAPFLVPGQPFWKDQALEHPAFYNATDAAVTAEGFAELWGAGLGHLQTAGLAAFYQYDVWMLNPLLEAMSRRGVPVDEQARLTAMRTLEQARTTLLAQIQQAVPEAAKPIRVFKRPRADTVPRSIVGHQKVCPACSAIVRTSKHPCARAGTPPVWTPYEATEYVQRQPFVVSPKGIKQYCRVRGLTLPKKFDKQTTNEVALRRLALRSEQDPVLPLLLQYREIEKILGTYTGRSA